MSKPGRKNYSRHNRVMSYIGKLKACQKRCPECHGPLFVKISMDIFIGPNWIACKKQHTSMVLSTVLRSTSAIIDNKQIPRISGFPTKNPLPKLRIFLNRTKYNNFNTALIHCPHCKYWFDVSYKTF